MAVHVTPPSVFTYERSFVVVPSLRRYNEPLGATSVGIPDPKNTPMFWAGGDLSSGLAAKAIEEMVSVCTVGDRRSAIPSNRSCRRFRFPLDSKKRAGWGTFSDISEIP